MRKSAILGMGLCVVLAFTSCKSSESAYKKAYDKAKQEELAQPTTSAPVEVTPVVTPVVTPKVEAPKQVEAPAPAPVREEKVTVVSGASALKDYSVVCGSFGLKANAEALKEYLEGQGYTAILAYNAEKEMYRVIMGTYEDRSSAERAREAFKSRYPNRTDFKESWILLRSR